MAATIPNIKVSANAWVDLSAESGIAVGAAYEITNQRGGWVLLHESSTEPSIEEDSGKRLASFPVEYSAYIGEGSLKIWARLLNDSILTGAELSLSEL